jgi:hypothetical protein
LSSSGNAAATGPAATALGVRLATELIADGAGGLIAAERATQGLAEEP